MDTAANPSMTARVAGDIEPIPPSSTGATVGEDCQSTPALSAGSAAPERAPSAWREQALARAAHELKAPLAVIKGSATTLLSNPAGWDLATQQEMLKLIDAQVDRLHDLVNGLLEIWRLEGGQLPVQTTPCRPQTLLGELAERWRTLAPAHAVHLALPADLPSVPLDAERVPRALDALMGHLVRSAPEGASIEIGGRVAGGELALTFLRRGPTPSPAERATLFEPLTGSTPVGTDAAAELGLPAARALIYAHGGRVTAGMPVQGTGLALELTLPLAPPHGLGTEAPHARTTQARGVHRKRERPTILIADDDPHLARYLRANVEAQGYRPVVALTTVQMGRLLDLEDPDLVLLDAGMVDQPGAPALQHLGEHIGVPVIVLGGGDEAECVRVLDQGAVDYLARPFGLGELLARVRAALRGSGRMAEGSQAEPLFRTGDLIIDFAQRQVRMGERPVPLSRTEYKLLHVLARHVGRVLSHELLLERVWGPGYNGEVEFLWVYMRRLRRKIEPDPRHPRYLLTVSGVGYRLAQL